MGVAPRPRQCGPSPHATGLGGPAPGRRPHQRHASSPSARPSSTWRSHGRALWSAVGAIGPVLVLGIGILLGVRLAAWAAVQRDLMVQVIAAGAVVELDDRRHRAGRSRRRSARCARRPGHRRGRPFCTRYRRWNPVSTASSRSRPPSHRPRHTMSGPGTRRPSRPAALRAPPRPRPGHGPGPSAQAGPNRCSSSGCIIFSPVLFELSSWIDCGSGGSLLLLRELRLPGQRPARPRSRPSASEEAEAADRIGSPPRRRCLGRGGRAGCHRCRHRLVGRSVAAAHRAPVLRHDVDLLDLLEAHRHPGHHVPVGRLPLAGCRRCSGHQRAHQPLASAGHRVRVPVPRLQQAEGGTRDDGRAGQEHAAHPGTLLP